MNTNTPDWNGDPRLVSGGIRRTDAGALRATSLRDRVQSYAPAPLTRFDQAVEAVQNDDRPKWDATVSRTDLVLKDGALEVEDGVRLHPTRWALGQMCARLGIPASYFASCPSVLQDVQANYWLKYGPRTMSGRALSRVSEDDPASGVAFTQNLQGVEGEKWLLRARGESLRAVLSNSYSPLDNRELLQALSPVVAPQLRVDWFALCDETMHLRLVDPSKTRDVLPGDGLSVGVHISNSEVGAKSLCVDALVYRVVCSNGLIALVKGQSLLKRRHVHIAPLRFRASLQEAVDAAFVTAEGFLEQLQSSTRQSVPDPEHAIEKLGEKWGLSEPVREAAKVALWREETGVRHSAYGLVNAFTGVAQLLGDEKRYDLEVLAGHLAQSGVPAFALAPREKQVAVTREVNGTQEEDITTLVQSTFDARIVSRRPSSLAVVGEELP